MIMHESLQNNDNFPFRMTFHGHIPQHHQCHNIGIHSRTPSGPWLVTHIAHTNTLWIVGRRENEVWVIYHHHSYRGRRPSHATPPRSASKLCIVSRPRMCTHRLTLLSRPPTNKLTVQPFSNPVAGCCGSKVGREGLLLAGWLAGWPGPKCWKARAVS